MEPSRESKVEPMGISAEPLPDKTSFGPRRVRLGDYLFAESVQNTSSACIGCYVYLYIIFASIALFTLRQASYEASSDFDSTLAITSALAATGFEDFFVDQGGNYEDFQDCQNLISGTISGTSNIDDAQSKSGEVFAVLQDLFNSGGNMSKVALSCGAYIFGATPSYLADICSPQNMELQFNGEKDETNCGVNSYNQQGCIGGFYQPYEFSGNETNVQSDLGQGPAKACPDGYWCPSSFTCIIRCPYGALCMASTMTVSADASLAKQASASCEYDKDVAGSKDAVPIYHVALSAATHDTKNVSYMCPGTNKIPMCPAGFYCPSSEEIYECPIGHYCPTGTYDPVVCHFKKIGCTTKGRAYPLVFEPVLVTIICFAVVSLLAYGAAQALRVKQLVKRREMQRVLVQARVDARKALHDMHNNRSFAPDEKDVGVDRNGDDRDGNHDSVDSMTTAFDDAAAVDGQLRVWLFFWLDQESHFAVVSTSVVVLGLALWTRVLPELVLSCIGIATSSIGFGLLHFKNKEKHEEKSAAVQSNPKRFSVVSLIQPASRASSKTVTARMESVELLGSLKQKTNTRVNLEFDKLGLQLNSNKRVVLAGVDGKLQSGSVTAIMGPSGAGKTTFLNALSGRATYGTTTGRLLINGEENNVTSLGRIVGFVPQEDTMHRELTVREILKAYAQMRLPRTSTAGYIERVVQDVIEALQLEHVSDSEIGDEAKRGISGGQRKRVNVGMEMVADPSLLFLDEPTSGLDSTTSFDLVFALKALASKGVNVIMVLHQPSYPLYKMFTNALLLGKGGRTVFLGKSGDALAYFTHIGYSMPPYLNPADFFMDVIAGKYERTPRTNAVAKFGIEAENRMDLFVLWNRHRRTYEKGDLLAKQATDGVTTDVNVKPIDPIAYAALKPAGFFRCFLVCSKRAFIQHQRSSGIFAFDVALHCGTGAFLGAASGVISLQSLAQTSLMFSLGLCMTVGLASLRVFGNERVVFWREAAPGAGMGLSPLPYFIGKTVVEIPRLCILTLCLVSFFYPYTEPLCNFQQFYYLSLVSAWNVSGWAVMLSIKLNDKSAQLMFVIFCLISLLYAGVQTRISEMSNMEYGISWLSPNRWLVEDQFMCHASGLSAMYRLPPEWYDDKKESLLIYLYAFSFQEGFNKEGGIRTRTQYDVLVSFWFGCLTRAIGFFFMVFSNREQMAQPPVELSVLRITNRFLNVFWPDLNLEDTMASVKACFDFRKRYEKRVAAQQRSETEAEVRSQSVVMREDELTAAREHEEKAMSIIGFSPSDVYDEASQEYIKATNPMAGMESPGENEDPHIPHTTYV